MPLSRTQTQYKPYSVGYFLNQCSLNKRFINLDLYQDFQRSGWVGGCFKQITLWIFNLQMCSFLKLICLWMCQQLQSYQANMFPSHFSQATFSHTHKTMHCLRVWKHLDAYQRNILKLLTFPSPSYQRMSDL